MSNDLNKLLVANDMNKRQLTHLLNLPLSDSIAKFLGDSNLAPLSQASKQTNADLKYTLQHRKGRKGANNLKKLHDYIAKEYKSRGYVVSAAPEGANEKEYSPSVNLKQIGLGDEHVSAINVIIQKNPNLRELNLTYNDLTDKGVMHLANNPALIHNKTLISLWLNNNSISEQGVKIIAKKLTQKNWAPQLKNLGIISQKVPGARGVRGNLPRDIIKKLKRARKSLEVS